MQLKGGLTGPIADVDQANMYGRRWRHPTPLPRCCGGGGTISTVAYRYPAPHATANDTKLTGNVIFRFRSYWKYAPLSCMKHPAPKAG